MPELRPGLPYIWITSLSKLLSGEHSCEWAAWFKAQHRKDSWAPTPSRTDSVEWYLRHTEMLTTTHWEWEDRGYEVFQEGQNAFRLQGRTAIVAGRPDLVAVHEDCSYIVDVKTGTVRDSDVVQMMMYMWMVPLALEQHRGTVFEGRIVYNDHIAHVDSASVDEPFIRQLVSLIGRLAQS